MSAPKLYLVQPRKTSLLEIPTLIRARRLLLEMTIDQAAELAGVSIDTWSALESGWIPQLDDSLWWSLAGTLQIRADRLLPAASADLWRKDILGYTV